MGADPHPEPTPLYPGSGGRNRRTPVELALVRGPGARTSWCEQALCPPPLSPPVTAPPRPKSGRARTRPHPVGTGPASVRVRGAGLGPVGPERRGECEAVRGGGGPGPPPGMPQITLSMTTYIFFRGSRACAGACKWGGRRALTALVRGCRPPPGTDPALPRFRGSEPADPCGTRSGAGTRDSHQLVRAGSRPPSTLPPGYCPSGTEVGASADPTSPRRNRSGIGPCQRSGPTTLRKREPQRVRAGSRWGGSRGAAGHASKATRATLSRGPSDN